MLANRDALARGVKISFIAHKHDKSNYQTLQSWTKMGLQVKHYADSGFHLVVFDNSISLLAVNNPKNTSDRTGFIFYNTGLSNAFGEYFNSIWQKAESVKN